MIVAEIISKFGLQQDKASFAKADASLQGLVNKAGKFAAFFGGMFAVNQIAHFINGLIEVGSELNDTSIKLGIATGALQEYRFAAQQTGATQQDLETGFRFLSRSAFDAASGGKETAKVYKRLGVEFKGADGQVRRSEDLFSDVAEALSKVDNETEKTALALKLFGRGGTALLPMLKDGSAGLEAMREEARALGGGFDEEFIKGADELGDNLDKLRFAGLGLKNILGKTLFPVLDAGVTKLLDWGKALFGILRGSRFVEIALMALAAVSLLAGARAIIPWLPFIFTFAAIAAAVTFAIALIDDIHALLTGGKSLIGQYLDEWFGIGTVDQLVRSWTSGIETLTAKIMGLVSVAGEAAGIIGDLFSGDFASAETRMTKLGGRIKEGFSELASDVDSAISAYTKTAMGTDPGLAQRTQGRGVDAALAGAEGIPRAMGRGMDAKLAPGSAGFGQASMDSVHPMLRPETQAFMGEGAARGSAASHAAGDTNNVNVTVNAHTGASPEEIGNIATKKVQEGLSRQNRNLKAAAVNRPAR